MDRNQEFNELLNEPTPTELEYSVRRAKARYQKSKVGRWCGIPAASLAGVAALFVLLVNTSIPFALAAGRVPFLKDLTAAVSFSPTLKAAVENDFVQYVGETKEVDGVSVTLEYLILDQSQINIFFTLGGEKGQEYGVAPDLQRPDGEPIGSYTSGTWYPGGGALCHTTIALENTEPLPEKVRLDLGLGRRGIPEGGKAFPHALYFDIDIDPRFTALQERVEVDRWFELDGQRLYIGTLDIYPLSASFTLVEDSANTASVSSLDLSLVDENGNRYGQGNGSLRSAGNTYYLGSSYFAGAKHLTLEIAGAEWLEKGKERTTIHFGTRKTENMPESAEIKSLLRFQGSVTLEIGYTGTGALFGADYYDPEGGEHHLDSAASSSIDRDGDGYCEESVDYITLPDYSWDSVELLPRWSRTSTFDTPVTVRLK